jgi:hypothetical protein
MKRIASTLVLALGLVFGAAGAAGAAPHLTASPRPAATPDCYPTCDGGGAHHHGRSGGGDGGAPSHHPATTPTTPVEASALAFTGTDAAVTVGAGLVLVVGGLGVVGVTRRRRNPAA